MKFKVGCKIRLSNYLGTIKSIEKQKHGEAFYLIQWDDDERDVLGFHMPNLIDENSSLVEDPNNILKGIL